MPGGRGRLRVAGAVALALWGLLGLAHGAVVLSRTDTGLFRDARSARVIGLPWQPGSRIVSATLDLLDDHAPGDAPVLVVGRSAVEAGMYHYVVFQLSHTAYPRELDFEGVHRRRPDPEYSAAIGVGGVVPGEGWEALAERGGVVLFLPARP